MHVHIHVFNGYVMTSYRVITYDMEMFHIVAALLHEIVAIYPAINPPTLTVRYNHVCVLLA